jgi:hypothetical protein
MSEPERAILGWLIIGAILLVTLVLAEEIHER